MYSSINFDKFIKPYNLTVIKIKKYFYHQKNKYISPLFSLHSLPPWLQVINNHWSTFCSHRLEFPFLEFHVNCFNIILYLGLCKWYHTVFTLLCLTSFTQHNAFEIHPVGLFLFIAEYYSIAWIYNFLTHLFLFYIFKDLFNFYFLFFNSIN